jgi:hypothetical protein
VDPRLHRLRSPSVPLGLLILHFKWDVQFDVSSDGVGQGYSISFEWGPVGGNDPKWGGREKCLKLMSITSIATDTVKHYNDIRVHIFSLFYQKEFNSLSKNNPYLIYVIGCLLVFNNRISSIGLRSPITGSAARPSTGVGQPAVGRLQGSCRMISRSSMF